MPEIHETINGDTIPVDNINYLGRIEMPYYMWQYVIFLKTGQEVLVKHDSRPHVEEDRNKLIKIIKNKPC